jgi:hypothetical protein
MSRLILDSRRRRSRSARSGAGQAPPGWEAAACGLLDRVGASSATDTLVLTAAGLASESGVTFEAARHALVVLAAAGIVVRQPDLTFRAMRAHHLPPVGRPCDPRLWVQMANSVLAWIELRLLEPGDSVPLAPSLAFLWDASRCTADKAYRELAWLGYLVKVPGRAFQVASSDALEAAAQRERTLAGWGPL